MSNIVKAGLLLEGKYWAEVRKDPTLDAGGEVISLGELVAETAPGKNVITDYGIDQLAVDAAGKLTAVAGSGNTTPTPADTTLVSFVGYTNTLASLVKTSSSTPDVDGYIYWRYLYKWTFNPGSLGAGAVNIAEAGMVLGDTTPNAANQIISRGLLVDGVGAPTTVSLDASMEYLYLYWELTYYVKASVTQTGVNITIDGVATPFDVEIRPTDFDNTEAVEGWAGVTGVDICKFGHPRFFIGGNAFSSCRALTGPLSDVNNKPTGTYNDAGSIDSYTMSAYTPGSKFRDFNLRWLIGRGNIVGGIGAITVLMQVGGGTSMWSFQVGWTPKIDKVDTKQLDLTFRFSMANK